MTYARLFSFLARPFFCMLTHVNMLEAGSNGHVWDTHPTHSTWGSSSHLRGCLSLKKGQDLCLCENPLVGTQISPCSPYLCWRVLCKAETKRNKLGHMEYQPAVQLSLLSLRLYCFGAVERRPRVGPLNSSPTPPLPLLLQCVFSQQPG